MAWEKPKTDWGVPNGVGVDDFNRIEGNVEQLGLNTGLYAGTSTGTASSYTVVAPFLKQLVEGVCLRFKAHANNSGASVLVVSTLGSGAILKGNGTTLQANALRKDSIYTVVHNGVNFILQGEGGGGTAVAGDIRAGKTAETDGGFTTGTLPSYPGGTVQPARNNILLPKGIYDNDILVAGAPINTGTLLEGNSVAGQAGTMLNRTARNQHQPGNAVSVWPGDKFFIMPPDGYYTGGSWVYAAVPGLTSANLRSGVQVADMVGSMGGAFPVQFNSPGPGANVGGYYEIFRIPAGWQYVSLAGRITQSQSTTNIFQKQGIVLVDIHGNELLLSGYESSSPQSWYMNGHGMFIDKPNRQITTIPDYSGGPSTGGWAGWTDMGNNGTFTKPFNMDNEIRLYFKIDASMGGGYTSAGVYGKLAYH